MRFPLFVAVRYLFSKKKNNIINLISTVSIVGIALATMAMVCVMSGFNGFKDLVGELLTQFDAQLLVKPTKGTVMAANAPLTDSIKTAPWVKAYSEVMEEDALILFKGRPQVIRLKGVDTHYPTMVQLKDILYGKGHLQFEKEGIHYGIPGVWLAKDLGGLDFGPTQVCVPKKGERINVANPLESINAADLYGTGLCFEIHQQPYDANMMICGLPFVQRLTDNEGKISQLELQLQEHADIQQVKQDIRQMSKGKLQALDRIEQHAEMYKIMNIEKLFAFLFLAFIALVATLNIVGTITMLILDKKEDANTLRYLGTPQPDITRIFLYEGRLITFIGATTGILSGILICLAQQQWGWLKLGQTAGAFIVDSYPVSIYATDLIIIYTTVMLVGCAAVEYPVRFWAKKHS